MGRIASRLLVVDALAPALLLAAVASYALVGEMDDDVWGATHLLMQAVQIDPGVPGACGAEREEVMRESSLWGHMFEHSAPSSWGCPWRCCW